MPVLNFDVIGKRPIDVHKNLSYAFQFTTKEDQYFIKLLALPKLTQMFSSSI